MEDKTVLVGARKHSLMMPSKNQVWGGPLELPSSPKTSVPISHFSFSTLQYGSLT